MSGSLNKVTLIGNVTADVDIRRTQDGRPIANFSLATNETWKDKSGERKEKAEFHRIVCFNEGLCKIIEQYIKRGSKLYIEGQLQTRRWQDQSGQDKYTTEIVMQNFGGKLLMLNTPQSDYDSGGGQSGQSSQDDHSQGNQGGFDDDVPFAPEWR